LRRGHRAPAMCRDVFLFFGQEPRVAWGVGKEEGGEGAGDDGDASFDEENEWPKFFSQGLPRFRCVTYQPLYPLMVIWEISVAKRPPIAPERGAVQ
jgi:hypothetical protein